MLIGRIGSSILPGGTRTAMIPRIEENTPTARRMSAKMMSFIANAPAIAPYSVGEILLAERVGRENDRRDQGDFVRLEHVGRHPGAIADVVADVVRDGGGVARVVLGDSGLDLADQVAADVSRLGVDAAADAHEERRERAAEAEAD